MLNIYKHIAEEKYSAEKFKKFCTWMLWGTKVRELHRKRFVLVSNIIRNGFSINNEIFFKFQIKIIKIFCDSRDKPKEIWIIFSIHTIPKEVMIWYKRLMSYVSFFRNPRYLCHISWEHSLLSSLERYTFCFRLVYHYFSMRAMQELLFFDLPCFSYVPCASQLVSFSLKQTILYSETKRKRI